jgi:hypothetical protein
MLQHLVTITHQNIATIQGAIKLQEKLTVMALESPPDAPPESDNMREVNQMIQTMGKQQWQRYNYCAALTRLYVVYEEFVENLIDEWLGSLPAIMAYSDLGDRIQNTHREGVGRLLLELKKKRFQHLNVENVVRSLFNGLSGHSNYELIPEAFLLHEQNLRKEVLDKLFADAGIEKAWAWVEKHREVTGFFHEFLGNAMTAEAQLNELIDYRNEAAHKVIIDETISSELLLNLCDFIKAICQALSELVTYHILLCKTYNGQAREIGQINRWFDKKQAARARIQPGNLAVGGTVFLVNENAYYCCVGKVESIFLNEESRETVELDSETEIGLKFDVPAKKGLRLYVMDE